MQATLENINVKVEGADKRDFITYTHNLGTNPSNAIRMFIKAFNERQGFPFDTSAPYKKASVADATYEEMIASSDEGKTKTYSTFNELLGDL